MVADGTGGAELPKPLGVLAPAADSTDWPQASLESLSGRIEPDGRAKIARYLRGASVIFAWMEYSEDLIGHSFSVAGGSSILSDGVYYWRLDAADYVERYGIEIPVSAIAHMATANWEPPLLDEAAQRRVYGELETMLLS